MPDVAFKDLVLDTTDPDLVAPWWAALLGLEAVRQDGGDWCLRGGTGAPTGSVVKQRTVWVNAVPEPLTVKNRVHLDVWVDGTQGPVAGSTVVQETDRWTVMADPQGLQWCAFDLREGTVPGPFELVVDAVDPRAIAQWWADRTGTMVREEAGKPWCWLEGVTGPYDDWVFQAVPEPKTVKNRVHWDVTLVDASVASLVAVGATVVRAQDETIGWTVLADPEGNEFCAFSP